MSTRKYAGYEASNEAEGSGLLIPDFFEDNIVYFRNDETEKAYPVNFFRNADNRLSGAAYTALQQAKEAGLDGVPAEVNKLGQITSNGYTIGRVAAWDGQTPLEEFNSDKKEIDLISFRQGSTRPRITPHTRAVVNFIRAGKTDEELAEMDRYLARVFPSVELNDDGELVASNHYGEAFMRKLDQMLSRGSSDSADVQNEVPVQRRRAVVVDDEL